MRRIAVTLDACQISSTTLEDAVQLAARMGAQLEGIFVEDIDLIQLAELPFLREVRSVSRSENAINLTQMEQELRVLARRAERLLGEHAARQNVSWSFRIWRGSIDTELLTADTDADVFALTRMGAGMARPPRTKAVSVVFTGTDASMRALETALSLTADPYKELNILLPAETEAEAMRLQELATRQLGQHAASADFIQLKDGSLNDMLDVLTESNSAVLIVERDSKLLQSPSLRRSLGNLNCPLLIVR
jgi:nucleotide-binding universal stress UspA family protein